MVVSHIGLMGAKFAKCHAGRRGGGYAAKRGRLIGPKNVGRIFLEKRKIARIFYELGIDYPGKRVDIPSIDSHRVVPQLPRVWGVAAPNSRKARAVTIRIARGFFDGSTIVPTRFVDARKRS